MLVAMEMRGMGADLPIYIPGGGHEWVETFNDEAKGNGVLIFDCANCDSVLALSFHRNPKRLWAKQDPGKWICTVQRSPNCCKEPD